MQSDQPRHARALVLMVKVPYPGTCKTRLSPPLTPREASSLYGCFLKDLARELPEWKLDADLVVAWADDDRRAGSLPESASDELPEPLDLLFGEHFIPLRQRGVSLTARMESVFETLTARGYASVVMRNSDSPHLPQTTVQNAFVALEREPQAVVLGPDLDGGYYLVGIGEGGPHIFPSVMSTATVLEQTIDLATKAGRPVVTLSSQLDIDTPEDLITFWLEFGSRADVRQWATWRELEGHPAWGRLTEDDPG